MVSFTIKMQKRNPNRLMSITPKNVPANPMCLFAMVRGGSTAESMMDIWSENIPTIIPESPQISVV